MQNIKCMIGNCSSIIIGESGPPRYGYSYEKSKMAIYGFTYTHTGSGRRVSNERISG